jgi:uncharacterized protein YgiM (DUF1202 family)
MRICGAQQKQSRLRLNTCLSLACLFFAAVPTQADWYNPMTWPMTWFAEQEPLQVTVNDTFINLYMGPGRSFPVFHVIERNEIITLIKSRTDWIQIQNKRGLEGWIHRDDMKLTLSLDGSTPDFPDYQQSDFLVNRFEVGAAYGDFDGADSLTINLGYHFLKNISAELRYAENTGVFSDSQITSANIIFQPYPQWRVSPYFGVGSGVIKIFPSATLVQATDREDSVLQASFGGYAHLTGRLFMRVEYTNHYILTSRNTNDEVNEWKLGLSVFF